MQQAFLRQIRAISNIGGKLIITSLIFTMIIGGHLPPGQTARAALGSVSATNNLSNGFPDWYADANGTRLSQCLAGTNNLPDPNCVVLADPSYNPTLPISFPDNFPEEFFYWVADSDKINVGPTREGRAVFRMALEGAFASDVPQIGQQITFLRLNMRRIRNLRSNSAYTVTHPYGTFTFQTDAFGTSVGQGGQAFRAEDGGFVPGTPDIFSALLPATNTKINTFLKAVNPAPPAGYLGDPNILQTITSGPHGNFLEINGPDIGGAGVNTVQTTLWGVAGKEFVDPASVLTSIQITPASAVVTVGDSYQFTATSLDQFDQPMTASVVWTTSDSAISTIDAQSGLFAAVAAGTVTVTATSGLVSGNATVTVEAAPAAPVLTRIAVAPATATLTVGQNQQFSAETLDQFGNPLPASLIWTSNNPLTGTINPTTGFFTALGIGQTTISAVSDSVSGSATVDVISPALQGNGPIDPTNGFPLWYTDSDGTKVGQCIAGANNLADPYCVFPPNAGLNTRRAISFPRHFPREFNYWSASSEQMRVGPRQSGRAVLQMNLEGAFAGNRVQAGKQIAFLRVNLGRITRLRPHSTYTATYPFGTFQFSTDSFGNSISVARQAYRAEDKSSAPETSDTFSALLSATNTKITTFLRAVNPAPPTGHLGNPRILQTITAGPQGNFFKIEGPDIGGAGIDTIQTTLWKIAGQEYTGSMAPQVYATDPRNNSTDVSVDKTIVVTFSEDIEPGSTYDSIELIKGGNKSARAVEITKQIVNNVLFIDPIDNLAYDKNYKLVIPKNAVEYVSGTYLPREYLVKFTTIGRQ